MKCSKCNVEMGYFGNVMVLTDEHGNVLDNDDDGYDNTGVLEMYVCPECEGVVNVLELDIQEPTISDIHMNSYCPMCEEKNRGEFSGESYDSEGELIYDIHFKCKCGYAWQEAIETGIMG